VYHYWCHHCLCRCHVDISLHHQQRQWRASKPMCPPAVVRYVPPVASCTHGQAGPIFVKLMMRYVLLTVSESVTT
jgi:hypothetical protein